jgi:two-component system heavy metal sensor histidine kinase CusS
MFVRSFKAKMALFSVCTSGLIFIAFALLLLKVSEQAAYDRMDRQLRRFAEGPVRRMMAPYQANPLQADRPLPLIAVEDEELRNAFPVRLIGRDAKTVHVSPSWPDALTVEMIHKVPPQERGDPEFPPLSGVGRPPRDDKGPMARRGIPIPPTLTTYQVEKKQWRVIHQRFQGVSAYVAGDLTEVAHEVRSFRMRVMLIVSGGLLLLAAGGWLLAGVALRPVKAVTRVAEQMTSAALHERVRVQGASEEFDALVKVINNMLERLEKSFLQAKRFSADAAHELKTPLTILQGQLDYALRHAPPESSEQQLYVSLLDEVQRLKSIVNKLLVLAQSDAGKLTLTKTSVSLVACVNEMCEDVPLLAPELTLDCVCEADVVIEADAALFRQVIQNLFSNAIKYNREKGTIQCRLRKQDGQAVLTIMNTLEPGEPVDVAHLFERFYRGDPSRNRKQDGFGLGLSLAREITRAHGGDLTVEALTDDTITFRLVCPLADKGDRMSNIQQGISNIQGETILNI